jgi:acyl-CoA synthetase (AMP-forming)/AMP-acid ligase II
MLRVGGEWVAPAEVEATIIEHPSVLEVAIVGMVDDRGITRPVAFVVAKEGASLSGDEVIEHCRSKLAGYKRPTSVMLVDSLPKTATGKIQRYKLRG